MNPSEKIFYPELYNYKDYKLWEGNWELIQGYPVAMSPSPKRIHQKFSQAFSRLAGNILSENKSCGCEIFYELDWVVNDNTVVRPDCMIVCGEFKEDYLTVPPMLILEISSPSTAMVDRNTKHRLYEMYGVKYYILADSEKKTVEVFQLSDNKYKETKTTTFLLTSSCSVELDVFNLWEKICS